MSLIFVTLAMDDTFPAISFSDACQARLTVEQDKACIIYLQESLRWNPEDLWQIHPSPFHCM